MLKLRDIRSKIAGSLWLLPSILVLCFILLAFLFLHLDRTYPLAIGGVIYGFFGGSASAARGLLSTIAGSLITVISMAFSITMVALQQASTQYSPRILRNFTSDKGNQIVLGTYLATFVYSLLILRVIRTDTDGSSGYVPALSISFSIILAIVCTGLLIYFINHITSSLQAEHLVKNIHKDLVSQIKRLFPDVIGKAVDSEMEGIELFEKIKESEETETVNSKKSGFLRQVDEDALERFNSGNIHAVYVMPKVGDFISEGQPVFEISKRNEKAEYDPETLLNALSIGYPRSTEQDPLFGVRMLVDIALKALSPAVHDPTTAEYCIYHLGDALCRLAKREFPPIQRTFENSPVIFIFNAPTWATFVSQAFGQIREAAQSSFHVTSSILEQLQKVSSCLPCGNRGNPVREILEQVKESLDKQPFLKRENSSLKEGVNEVEKFLMKPPNEKRRERVSVEIITK